MASSEEVSHDRVVVAFVETDVLPPSCWLRAMNWNAVESGFEKFDVVSVGTTDLNSQGNTTCVSEHRSLGSQFAAIGRVFACIFPHPEAS